MTRWAVWSALAALAFPGAASAGPIVDFGGPASTTVPNSPNDIAIGDFNGDSDPDLAAPNNAGSVSILTGGAGGSFSLSSNVSGGGGTGVAVGEFNGDTDPDLAIANSSGVQILTGTGASTATFAAGSSLTAGSFPVEIAVAEINGDADPDLIVTNQSSDNVSVLTGTGAVAATFAAAVNFPVGDGTGGTADRPFSVAVADFNGDSDPDLATANIGAFADPADDEVTILTGDGTTAVSFTSADITVGDGPDDIISADFNGDSDPDLAVANSSSGTGGGTSISILSGTAGAGFVTSATLFGSAAAVTTGDFNQDGDLDLAASDGAVGTVAIRVGQAGSAFGSEQDFPAGPGTVRALASGNFDGPDARPDIAGPNSFNTAVSVLLNTSDLVAPDTTIGSGPTGPTNDNTPTFGFTSNEGGPNFECRVPPAAFAPCTSPHTTGTLGDSGHTFEVRAVDAGGNIDGSAATRSFTVDTVPPDTSISSGPVEGSTINDNTPTFGFSASGGGTGFQCRVLPAGTFAPCTSMHTTAPLIDGPHTFEVRASDAAGNLDADPATRSFTVDTGPPETTIASGPSGPTNDNTPTFEFTSTEGGSTFECRVVPGGAVEPCPTTHTTPPLADGSYTIEVQSLDAVGNLDASPASRSFVVDTVAPETAIDSGPPPSPSSDQTATFAFSSNETGAAFACSLDGAVAGLCSSPASYGPLAIGSHMFSVAAIDPAGNFDSTPASQAFDITGGQLPPPVLGQSTNVEPVSGRVLVGIPAGAARSGARAAQKGVNFVPLEEARQIPVGSFLDTKRGTVSLTTAADAAGATQSGQFSKGLFQVLQARNAKGGLTELRLKGSSFSNCRVGGRGKRGRGGARAAARKRLKSSTKRRLTGNANGNYRSGGRHSSATVRGTIWTVADRCDGTLTTVKRGKVAVRDFRRKRTIVLKAGKRYLAKAPG